MEKKELLHNTCRLLILSLVLITIIGISLSLKFSVKTKGEPVSSPIETTQKELQSDSSTITPTPLVPTETQQKALSLYDQGLKLYYDRQFDPALALFNEALSMDPDCYQAMNGKGATYAFLGRYDEGVALIQQAIGMKPDFVYARFNSGLANELAGRWDAALEAYHSAITLDSKDVWSYYGSASIYGRQGNVDKVVEYLKQAIDLQPDVKDVAQNEKDFDPVKDDSRFQALLK